MTRSTQDMLLTNDDLKNASFPRQMPLWKRSLIQLSHQATGVFKVRSRHTLCGTSNATLKFFYISQKVFRIFKRNLQRARFGYCVNLNSFKPGARFAEHRKTVTNH